MRNKVLWGTEKTQHTEYATFPPPVNSPSPQNQQRWDFVLSSSMDPYQDFIAFPFNLTLLCLEFLHNHLSHIFLLLCGLKQASEELAAVSFTPFLRFFQSQWHNFLQKLWAHRNSWYVWVNSFFYSFRGFNKSLNHLQTLWHLWLSICGQLHPLHSHVQ